jgi:hypothetical protein
MVLVLVLSAGTGYACKCTEHNLLADIAYSDAVFIGKVIDKKEVMHQMEGGTIPVTAYTFEVKKGYKGNATPGVAYTVYQGGTSCTRGMFLVNETYLIFSEKNSVSQCSLSDRFENNRNVTLLDSIYKNSAISAKGINDELKQLKDLFTNTILLSNYSTNEGSGTTLTIGDKKVVFWDGNKKIWLGKLGPKESDNWFYATQYYLAADSRNSEWLRETGADYLIYVTNVHQGLTLKPGYMNENKPKPKVYKKIKAITSI